MGTTQSDIEIARYVSKMIFQFLFGKSLAEIEAEMLETTPVSQEHHAKQVHDQALERLRSIGLHFHNMGLDPVGPDVWVTRGTSADRAQENHILQEMADMGALADVEPKPAALHQAAVDRLESMARGFSSTRAGRSAP